MSNKNLNASRWAPAASRNNNYNYHQPTFTPTSTTRSRSTSPPRKPLPTKQPQLTKTQKLFQHRSQNHHKFTKLFRRLKWKATALLFCHHRTLEHIHNHNHNINNQNTISNDENPLTRPITATEAKTMFKIDFFEFYVLLERVLVHLLEIFGITVSAIHARDIQTLESDGSRPSHLNVNSTTNSLPAPQLTTLVGDSHSFHNNQSSTHSFHANVLSALDQPTNPLHTILGTGVVRDYLGIAKEFRNRWKDVDDKIITDNLSNNNLNGSSIITNDSGRTHHSTTANEDNDRDEALQGSRYERMTEDLKLEEMLASILSAIEKCMLLADKEVHRVRGDVEREINAASNTNTGAGSGTGGANGGGNNSSTIMMTMMEVDMLGEDHSGDIMNRDGGKGWQMDGYYQQFQQQYSGKQQEQPQQTQIPIQLQIQQKQQQQYQEGPWEAIPDAMEWD